MKNKLLTLAGTLALIAVLGKFYAVPAIAQAVGATLVKNIDEPGRSPYKAVLSCGTPANNCNAYNTITVPAGKRLVLTGISGSIQGAGYVAKLLYVSNNTQRYLDVPPPITNYSGIFTYQFSQPVHGTLEAGDSGSLYVALTGNNQLTVYALLTGYLIDLNR